MAIYKLPLVLTPQVEGGYTVTSPILPELITEGDTIEEALANVRDALEAVRELYDETGRSLPASLLEGVRQAPISLDFVVDAA